MSAKLQPTPMDQGEQGSDDKGGPAWLIAALMAAVVLATAIAAWRTSDLGSKAGDAERQGLIEAIQVQSLLNEDWRLVYEQATNAQRFLALQAEVEVLAASGETGETDQAQAFKDYLLPNLALLAGPLVQDPSYLREDGSLDLEARFEDEQALNDALAELDPQGAFSRADRLHAQHRQLIVGTVLLAVGLFWLALAEISRDRGRRTAMIIGLAFFAIGLGWFGVAELMARSVTGGGL